MNKNEKNEIILNDDTDIKNVVSKRGKDTLSIDGYVLTQKDVLIFKCQRCGKETRQRFLYLEKFLNHNFICESCSKKETNKKRYGFEHVLQNKEKVEKARKTMEERYGGWALQSKEILNTTKNTNKLKYGVENPYQSEVVKNKIKKTNKKKYGFEYISQSEEIKEKIKQNNLNKYGTESHNSLNEVKEKKEASYVLKYGVKNPNQSEEIKKKKEETHLTKYGVKHVLQNPVFLNKFKKTQNKKFFDTLTSGNRLKNKVEPLFNIDDIFNCEKYTKHNWKCVQCGTIFDDSYANGRIPRCPVCYPPLVGTSKYEEELYNWLESLNIRNIIKKDRKVLKSKELDIYLSDYNLAIEFDGLYWHSESQGKNRSYHLDKTLECEKQGVKLIHIFEDEWIRKQEIVKSVIKGSLGLNNKIGARKCIVKEVDNQKKFLEENHLQGFVRSKVNIGLYYSDELISLLTFGAPRYNKQYDWEILRFATKLNTSIIGGFAKMLKYFQSNYEGSIITYSDKRYFDGSVYKNNGFKELSASPPNYFYTDYKNLFSRIQFQKHKLEEKLDYFDSDMTEWGNMQMNGWDRIWDCGNNVFIL